MDGFWYGFDSWVGFGPSVVGVWLGGNGLCCVWIGGGGSGLCWEFAGLILVILVWVCCDLLG